MNTILEVRGLSKAFSDRGMKLQAVSQVSFQVQEGQCFGVVGESGSGKSTVAKMLMGLLEADSGDILLEGKSIREYAGNLRAWYQKISMVFQMPVESFNPRITLGRSILSPMLHFGMDKRTAQNRLAELLEQVKLPGSYQNRYPYEVSGGECQRAAIARALGPAPRVLVCDEATSALDVSVQADIVELLKNLQRELNLTILFISHDLGLVQELCDEMIVMYRGQIVEQGKVEDIIDHPQEEYTRNLLDSVLDI